MASIVFIVDQIKSDPARFIERLPIRQVCDEMNLVFRERTLDPATTIGLFIRQILNDNRSCAGVRHWGKRKFTAQAYCSARKRLPLEALQRLSRKLCEAAQRRVQEVCNLFLLQNVFVVDGSSFSMPDTPELQAHFGQPGRQARGCGFPIAHLLALFDLNSGMLMDGILSPMRTHDLRHAWQLHPRMREGDVLLGDTAFGSYAHFALLYQAKLHGLTPPHQQRIIDFTPNRPFAIPGSTLPEDAKGLPRSRWIRSLGKDDQIVEWFKPVSAPAYMSQEQFAALPDSLLVRELRRRVHHPGLEQWVEIEIVTTLLDETTHPAETLLALRLRRWQVELNLRHLKTTMGMEQLKCKSVEGVKKECAVFMLVYNLLRLLMIEAAIRQKTQPDRISFKDVLHWTKSPTPDQPMPLFIINKPRPKRIEPRAIKRRPKKYALMNKPRERMREDLKKQVEMA